ncbi:MAG: SurA N-terminal domain-containing protein [Sphingomonadales bacterium]|nr:SurA N-terminal domain-containing protein [Sphingomonadales bacterium]
MLQTFRNFFQSKWGVGFTLGFLGLIALAFASGDVVSSGGFGAFGTGDKVATVGKQQITAPEVENSINNILTRMRQSDPNASMAGFLAQDGLNELLDFLIDRKAARQFGESHGIHISDRLIDSEIAKIQRIQAPDGKVDPTLYRQFLAERGQTDAQFRAEVAEDLVGRQLAGSGSLGVFIPQKIAVRYANVVTERRKGLIFTLPAAAFAPKTPPSEAEITQWYDRHKADYALPERRTIRYITFGDSVLKNVPAPTDAEIAARYEANKEKYAPTSKRKLAQLVLPTEAAAKAVAAEVSGGKSLEASAAAKGLSVAKLEPVTKEEYALQSSGEAANAVFGAATGKVVGPVKGTLGWLVVRIEGTVGNPGKTLDQARPELVKELGEEKRRGAIAEFSGKIEEDMANGATLTDLAKDMGLQITETPPLLASGGVYGKDGATAPKELAPVLQTAFGMESEKQPQLAEIDPGKTFMIFDVGTIAAAAPPPLAQIRNQVIADIQLDKGAKLAKAAAEKVKGQVEKGVAPEVALASVGVSLPPVDRVDKTRAEVQAQGQNASKPEMLVFVMAKGKVRTLAAPRNRGWYVVSVTEVIPGNVTKDDKRLPSLQEDFKQSYGGEYAAQMGGAMRSEVGATRNEANVSALKKRLEGNK